MRGSGAGGGIEVRFMVLVVVVLLMMAAVVPAGEGVSGGEGAVGLQRPRRVAGGLSMVVSVGGTDGDCGMPICLESPG